MNDSTDGGDGAEALDPEPPRRRRERDDDDEGLRKRLWLLGPLAVAAVGIVGVAFLVVDSGTYSKPVDQLVARRAVLVGKPVRTDGILVHGSLGKGANGCDHRFTIAKNGAELPVRFPDCVTPDRLKDIPGIDVEVEVEGKLQADGLLLATRVMTKCPSRYEEERLATQGAKAPH